MEGQIVESEKNALIVFKKEKRALEYIIACSKDNYVFYGYFHVFIFRLMSNIFLMLIFRWNIA